MRRVLLVGDSLFADTLKQMLAGNNQIAIVGVCTSPEQLPSCIADGKPDAVLVADAQGDYLCARICIRVRSDLPIIYTTLKDDHLTIFTSRRVKAAQAQLLDAITNLPERSQ
jgi:hypothetical protein